MWSFTTRPAQVLPAPVEEAHKGIDEFLLEDRLPAGACDMNFRLPSLDPSADRRRTVVWLTGIGFLAVPMSLTLTWWIGPLVSRVECLVAAYIVALLASILEFALPDQSGNGLRARAQRALPWLLGPPLLWLAAAATAWTSTRHGALLYLLFCGLPALCVAADRMATHSIYWMTASPGVGNAEMLSCRAAWDGRWSWIVAGTHGPRNAPGVTPALVVALKTYPLRPAILAVGIVLPVVIWTWSLQEAPSCVLNMGLLTAVAAGLLGVATLSVGRRRQAVRVFRECLVHWLQHGREQPVVPWVFESPLGPCRRRQDAAAMGLILLAPGLLGLTEWCSVIPPDDLQLLGECSDTIDPHSPLTRASVRWMVRALLCAGSLVFVFVAGLFAMVGPILLRGHELLEE